MMIDKVAGVNPLNNLQETKRTNNAKSVRSSSDEISVSKEASLLSE